MPFPDTNVAPRQHWNSIFSAKQIDPEAVRNAVLKLNQKRQHEQVIALIESALIHDQSQAWMYDVLAASMRAANRPSKEIERVLLSRVDFGAGDVQNILLAAAYLSRFGDEAAALRLYRQASNLAPERPEAYILGLKHAQAAKDPEAIGWAAAGILSYGWVEDFRTLHRDAENAAIDAQTTLRNKGDHDAARTINAAIAEAKQRDLSLQLTWSGPGDLDLIVEEPGGSVCSYKQRTTTGGGILVQDGAGPRQENCVETYVCPRGRSGSYRIRIRHVLGNIVGKRARLTIVRNQGSDHETTRQMAVPLAADDAVIRVPLEHGRRTAPAVMPTSMRVIQPGRSAVVASDRTARTRQAARRFEQSRQFAAPMSVGAVGYQPVIAVIPDGVGLAASAVVSADRRYVRLSMSPSFTTISDVLTFSFINNGNPAGGGAVGGGPGN